MEKILELFEIELKDLMPKTLACGGNILEIIPTNFLLQKV